MSVSVCVRVVLCVHMCACVRVSMCVCVLCACACAETWEFGVVVLGDGGPAPVQRPVVVALCVWMGERDVPPTFRSQR